MRTLLQNVFTNAHKCKNISRHARKLLHMHKTQMRKSANVRKNRRAQNAQICSANIFPNAEITNLHCAQKHKCKFLQSVEFSAYN